jgi:hypothetical protein
MTTYDPNYCPQPCEFTIPIKLNIPIEIEPKLLVRAPGTVRQKVPVYLEPDIYLEPEVQAKPPVCTLKNGYRQRIFTRATSSTTIITKIGNSWMPKVVLVADSSEVASSGKPLTTLDWVPGFLPA